MRKLNKKKIAWILRWKGRGLTNRELADSQRISPRWVKHLCSEYRKHGRIVVKKSGRPRKPVPIEHIKLILDEHPRNSGAVILESRIEGKHKIHIPHNTIHMVLKHAGYAKDEPKKQKRRKWVRYEREHSLSLVHTDWHESKVVPGKWVIAYLDDASRMILAMDEYDHATTENSVKTLRKAMKTAEPYGGIRQLLTDNGSQFLKEFNKAIEGSGIEHIYTRVNHPQTNSKIEKFYDTYNKKRSLFKSLEEFVLWYNTDSLHMSLNMHYAETPSQAFLRKMDTTVWMNKAKSWFE